MCAIIKLSSDDDMRYSLKLKSLSQNEEMGATKLKSGLEDASGNPQIRSQKHIKSASPRIVIKIQ